LIPLLPLVIFNISQIDLFLEQVEISLIIEEQKPMENQTENRLSQIASQFNVDQFQVLNEEMSLSQYLEAVYENPKLIRSAFQKLYDMVMEAGSYKFERYRKTLIHYHFFDDPEIPIFGLEKTLDELVKFIRGAAGCYGTEKRVLLLHGPVGSSKSTICRLMKRGLERYSRKDDGKWYSYRWTNLPNDIYTKDFDDCPMHEYPIKLLPLDIRTTVVRVVNDVWRD